MPVDSALDARVAPVVPLRSGQVCSERPKGVLLSRFLSWRRSARGEGAIALAEIGRETGARC